MDLSIIIVNYNTRDLLKKCLGSIFLSLEKTKLDFEVIVVDNGSNDGSIEYLRNLELKKYRDIEGKIKRNLELKKYRDIEGKINKSLNLFTAKSLAKSLKVIFNNRNLGFGRANNQAFRQAQGDYILFLNPDTLVLDNSLEFMVDYLKNHSEVGVLGCQILNKENAVISSGGYFPSPWRVFLWASALDHFSLVRKFFGRYHPPASFFTKEKNLDWVQGCALMVRREIFQKVNGFDPNFFMYGEEVELCLRIKKEGRKVLFWPKSKIVHLGGQKKEPAILGEFKGLLLYYQKHYPFFPLPILKLIIRLAILLRILVFGIIRKDENLKKAYFKAWQAF